MTFVTNKSTRTAVNIGATTTVVKAVNNLEDKTNRNYASIALEIWWRNAILNSNNIKWHFGYGSIALIQLLKPLSNEAAKGFGNRTIEWNLETPSPGPTTTPQTP